MKKLIDELCAHQVDLVNTMRAYDQEIEKALQKFTLNENVTGIEGLKKDLIATDAFVALMSKRIEEKFLEEPNSGSCDIYVEQSDD